jgi:hypothetical protein
VGIEPVGFAAPHGCWNAGLNAVLEELGYLYSSEFQVGYDDFPSYPWLGDRFSRVLQVPIHPICEGLFLDAGVRDEGTIARHFVETVRAKVMQGEPAFVYGHPERRLAYLPGVLEGLSEEVSRYDLLWRVTLTEFARWWIWRGTRRWSLIRRGEDGVEIQFEDWDGKYPLAVEIVRGMHVASVPVRSGRTFVGLSGLSYERQPVRRDGAAPRVERRPFSLSGLVKAAVDWETVTPLGELRAEGVRGRLKWHMRRWRDAQGTEVRR